MKKPLFSIVIPSFNGMETLGIALESICRQTVKDIEVIVSDDNGLGTPAQIASEEIVGRFKNRLDITYLPNEHVNGSHARNKGLEIAKGEYISLLDDDDLYMPEYVEKAIDTFSKNIDIDFLFFNVAFISREGVARIVENEEIDSVDLLFGRKEIGTGSNICFRRKVLESGYFDERYLRYQDIEFIAKKLKWYKSLWVKELEIVKYYNVNENYLNYEKALKMQKMLREDMVECRVLSQKEADELEIRQQHTLYNDMLVKNMGIKDIDVVYGLLKEKNVLSLVDWITHLVYSISPSLFRFVYCKLLNRANNGAKDIAAELLKYRNCLKENEL